MLDQITFDRSEGIAEALHSLKGLEMALIHALDPLLAKAGPDKECTVMALLNACAAERLRAERLARQIATSEK